MPGSRPRWIGLVGALLASACAPHRVPPWAVDLSHAVPTFEVGADGADLARPRADSVPVPSFGDQAAYEVLPPTAAGQGHFYAGRLLLYDHHGTHLDAPADYRNAPATLEQVSPDQRYAAELGAEDLVGPVVFLDLGERVGRELARNAGEPSPDTAVTDFSNASDAVVSAADIDALAGRLRDGVWIVVHTGWSRFSRNWPAFVAKTGA